MISLNWVFTPSGCKGQLVFLVNISRLMLFLRSPEVGVLSDTNFRQECVIGPAFLFYVRCSEI